MPDLVEHDGERDFKPEQSSRKLHKASDQYDTLSGFRHHHHQKYKDHHDIQYLIFRSNVKIIIREPVRKKIRDFLGVFPKCRTPPAPFLEGLRPKKIKGLFCVLGPKEHFWFLQKNSLFVSILTYTFGNRGPPPLQGKTPK